MPRPLVVVRSKPTSSPASQPVGPAVLKVPRVRRPVRCDVVLAYCQADERFLPQSAESILNQNYADVTLHLVADGFDPGRYARELATEANVRLYRNETSIGPYVSAMRVWDRMETPYFAVQDADDVSLPDRIWDAVTTLERERGDLFGACLIHFLDRQCRGDARLAAKQAREPYHRSGVVWMTTAPLGMCLNPTLVVRRSAFEALNGFAGWKCSGDCEFNTRARKAGLKVVVSPHLHGLRRLRRSSLSHGDQYGMGTEGRRREIEKATANYAALDSGADPRSLGTLDKHRSGTGTVWLNPPKSATPAFDDAVSLF